MQTNPPPAPTPETAGELADWLEYWTLREREDGFEPWREEDKGVFRRIASILRAQGRADDRETWRCFHCGEVFTSRKYAAEHFGAEEGDVPACRLSHSEGHLVALIRKLQAENAVHRREDSHVLRAMHAREAEQGEKIRRSEEAGYNRGVRDARTAEVRALPFAPSDYRWAVERADDHSARVVSSPISFDAANETIAALGLPAG